MIDHQEPTVKRNYIDPWDLENIEYIHRHLRSSPEPSINDDAIDTPSPAGEPVVASTFYYLSGGGGGGGDVRGDGSGRNNAPGAVGVVSSGGLGGANCDNVADDDDHDDDDCVYVIQSNNNHNNHEIEEHTIYDCTSGCYAGLDEELFYNSTKYESIHDDPSVGIYYTDIESSSSSMERTSSSGGSTVSTLQLHTPGFGVRASGRRSIVLPKPIPHIEFPPAPPLPPILQLSPPPPSTEYYHTVDDSYNYQLQQQLQNHHQHHHHQQYQQHNHNTTILRSPECHNHHHHHQHHHHRNYHNYSTSPLRNIMNTTSTPRSTFIKSLSDPSDDLLNDDDGCELLTTNLIPSYCRPPECYDCVNNTRIPLYDLNSQVKSSQMVKQSLGRRRHRNLSVANFGGSGGGGGGGSGGGGGGSGGGGGVGIDAYVSGGIDDITGDGNLIGRPPNNFGLSKRGLLQIDYSFNWNNLYHFMSK